MVTIFDISVSERPTPSHRFGLAHPNGSVWMTGNWFTSPDDVRRYAAAGGWKTFAITEAEAQCN